jgi:hypothetical protein
LGQLGCNAPLQLEDHVGAQLSPTSWVQGWARVDAKVDLFSLGVMAFEL